MTNADGLRIALDSLGHLWEALEALGREVPEIRIDDDIAFVVADALESISLAGTAVVAVAHSLDGGANEYAVAADPEVPPFAWVETSHGVRIGRGYCQAMAMYLGRQGNPAAALDLLIQGDPES